MPPEETSTLELRDYFRVLRRHKWIISATMVLCLGAALAMSLLQAPVYSAGTRVLLEERLVDKLFVPTDQQGSGIDANRERGNEIQVMSSPRVRALVADKLGRDPEPADFVPLEGTDVVVISVRSTAAKNAAETANAFAETYIEVRRDLTITELDDAAKELQARITEIDQRANEITASFATSPSQTQIGPRGVTFTDSRETELTQLGSERQSYSDQIDRMRVGASVARQGGAKVLAEAVTPTEPINRNPVRNGIAGLAIGVVLAIALAFLREYLDDTVKTKEDLESASGITAVGLIPELPDWKNRDITQLISLTTPRSPAAEAYRTVRTSVEFLGLDQPIGSLQVTSSMASEGKTTTLSNLAITFARAGQRVIVLCCDLRRPRVHEFFGLSNRVGFTSMLLGDVPVNEAIQAVPGDLPIGLVASGPLPPNPAELLASKRAVAAIEELDRRCDLLLIDSPPVLPVTDALVISGLVDGVLLVGSVRSSTKRGIRRTVELLRQVDAPLIGSILNGVHSKSEYGYVYGDNRYYLEPPSPKSDQRKAPADRRNGRRKKPASPRSSR